MALETLYLISEIIVLVTGLTVLMLDLVIKDERRNFILAGVSIAGLLLATGFAVVLFGERISIMSNMFVVDSFSIVIKVVVLLGASLSILLAIGFLQRPKSNPGEYYFLLLTSTLGMMIMSASTNLMVVFLGIQLASIPMYILTGFKRSDTKSSEAALKYFLLGILTAAVSLYGMSLLYGLTGTLNLAEMGKRLATLTPDNPVIFLGMTFVIAGITFKIAAVPFHFWAPDVYEGAPTPVASFIAAVPKVAGFAVLVRLVYTAFPTLTVQWAGLLALMAVLTMLMGNFLAIPQKNIKRMLAFSGIAHMGYALITLAVPGENALGALVFYLVTYGAMTGGAFAIVTGIGRVTHEHEISDFAGLGSRSPVLAAAMTLFLLSMLGFPLTAGFIGKFLIFGAAIEKGMAWLALIGVANSVISLLYYFGVVRTMYLEPAQTTEPIKISALIWFVIGVAALVVIILGIYPEPMIHLSRGVSLLFTSY